MEKIETHWGEVKRERGVAELIRKPETKERMRAGGVGSGVWFVCGCDMMKEVLEKAKECGEK